MADAEGEILTLDEVAVYLKAGKRTVYRLPATLERVFGERRFDLA
jgi:hypothetical protein